MPSAPNLSYTGKNTGEHGAPQIHIFEKDKKVNYGKEKTATTVISSIAAGSMAGIVNTCIFHPTDVIRTKIQFSNSGRSSTRLSSFGVLKQTINHGGIRSLYTGLALPVCCQACYKSTIFTVNKVARTALVEWKVKRGENVECAQRFDSSETVLCGALAGAINGILFVVPVEFVRNQLIAQDSRLAAGNNEQRTTGCRINRVRGPVDVIRRSLRKSGGFGLWRGASVTVLRGAGGMGAWFYAFETMKEVLTKVTGEDSRLVTMASGAAAGVSFWVFAMPFDTAKTLVQTGHFKSASNVFRTFFERDGIKGLFSLYRGWEVAFLRGIPSGAVTIGVYDFFSKLISSTNWFNE